jgi:hypothetical protein
MSIEQNEFSWGQKRLERRELLRVGVVLTLLAASIRDSQSIQRQIDSESERSVSSKPEGGRTYWIEKARSERELQGKYTLRSAVDAVVALLALFVLPSEIDKLGSFLEKDKPKEI